MPPSDLLGYGKSLVAEAIEVKGHGSLNLLGFTVGEILHVPFHPKNTHVTRLWRRPQRICLIQRSEELTRLQPLSPSFELLQKMEEGVKLFSRAERWKGPRFSLTVFNSGWKIPRNNSMDFSVAMVVASMAPFVFG
jgi:hypothetical protein